MDVIVGIDVSKDRLDVHVLPAGDSFLVGNDQAGVDGLITRLREAKADVVALEATGGYEMLAAAGLSSAGLAVVVVNPAQVRSYANALGKRAKTDPIDAAVIAAFVAATKPDIRPVRDEESESFSAIVSRRRQIVRLPEGRAPSPPRSPARTRPPESGGRRSRASSRSNRWSSSGPGGFARADSQAPRRRPARDRAR